MAETGVEKDLKLWRKRRDKKREWHNHYDDLARVYLPNRLGFATTVVEGERRTEDLFDGTPMMAARGLANAVGWFLRPQGLPVVKMTTGNDALDQREEVAFWFDDSQKRLKGALGNPKARYMQATGETDLDLAVFGTGPMFVGEAINRSSLIFRSIHLKDATPVFDDEGNAHGMYQEYKLAAWQLEKRFGSEKLSEKVRLALSEDREDEDFQIVRIVMSRKEGREDALFSNKMPFTDQWVEVEAKHKIVDGGFREFPFIIPRWDTTSGEDMGRSPGMIGLPDADTLQAMGETVLISGQRQADPPLAVPNDGAFDAINTFPGGLAYYDVETAAAVGGNPFFPIESGANLPITRDMQNDTRTQLWAAFYRNILNLPIQGPEMTATEIIARKEELMREIGPAFGRLQTDYTAPKIERSFMIMLRAGAFLPIPRILLGRNVRFEYDDPTKRIRQQIEAAAAQAWVREQIELAQFKPGALDLINEDEVGRFKAEAMGVPRKLLNTPDMVESIRQTRQQQIQAQVQAEAMKGMVDMMETGSKAGKNIASAEAT